MKNTFSFFAKINSSCFHFIWLKWTKTFSESWDVFSRGRENTVALQCCCVKATCTPFQNTHPHNIFQQTIFVLKICTLILTTSEFPCFCENLVVHSIMDEVKRGKKGFFLDQTRNYLVLITICKLFFLMNVF